MKKGGEYYLSDIEKQDYEMGIRIKEIRTCEFVNLNQTDFGQKIGVGQSAIGLYENGKRTVPETVKKSICREFNVNYLFLDKGIGEMFADLPETAIDELAIEFDLDESEKDLVRDFVKLPKEQRKILMDFLRRT